MASEKFGAGKMTFPTSRYVQLHSIATQTTFGTAKPMPEGKGWSQKGTTDSGQKSFFPKLGDVTGGPKF